MLKREQVADIHELIRKYRQDEKAVTKKDILELAERLTPNSPRTGKLIRVTSLGQYLYHCVPNELTKYDYICLFNYILENDPIEPKGSLGFFNA